MAEGRVEFEGVWKKFRRGEHHDSLRDLVPAAARRWRGGRTGTSPRAEARRAREFWAVRDVSFRVESGRALGIIGPNGAGKSTVLKLLTRILRPTQGRARVTGRVGALIEIAAGFHPDLTGRENVRLQGAMMGMRRREVERQFDAIVSFSELEDFIDTPVKRYSSGMNARLGFSIAAHLDPEVLIIDEVLAVGDHAFQRKAFDRIREMTRRDIPVVIVSHQLERIVDLCSEAILLDRGCVRHAGPPEECVAHYLGGATVRRSEETQGLPLRVDRMELEGDATLASGEEFVCRVVGEAREALPEHVTLQLRLLTAQRGQLVFLTSDRALGAALPAQGPFALQVALRANLGRGLYVLEACLHDLRRRVDLGSPVQRVLRVAVPSSFHGLVNLDPRARVAAAPVAAEASAGRP